MWDVSFCRRKTVTALDLLKILPDMSTLRAHKVSNTHRVFDYKLSAVAAVVVSTSLCTAAGNSLASDSGTLTSARNFATNCVATRQLSVFDTKMPVVALPFTLSLKNTATETKENSRHIEEVQTAGTTSHFEPASSKPSLSVT